MQYVDMKHRERGPEDGEGGVKEGDGEEEETGKSESPAVSPETGSPIDPKW